MCEQVSRRTVTRWHGADIMKARSTSDKTDDGLPASLLVMWRVSASGKQSTQRRNGRYASNSWWRGTYSSRGCPSPTNAKQLASSLPTGSKNRQAHHPPEDVCQLCTAHPPAPGPPTPPLCPDEAQPPGGASTVQISIFMRVFCP